MKESNEKFRAFFDPNILSILGQRGYGFANAFEKMLTLGTLATDVKALQEIVYRYHLMGETGLGYQHAEIVRKGCRVYPVTSSEIEMQVSLLARYPMSPPRELLHVAVMNNHGIQNIVCSPESSYYEIDGIHVLSVFSSLGFEI